MRDTIDDFQKTKNRELDLSVFKLSGTQMSKCMISYWFLGLVTK